MDQGDLAWLADVDLSRLRLTYGLTSSLSLAVNYSFTLEEMRSAAFSPSGSSEAMKTGFHETVHVYQMTGTSYGYYCQLLRDFQVNQVILMVEAIRRDYRVRPAAADRTAGARPAGRARRPVHQASAPDLVPGRVHAPVVRR